MDQIKSSAWKLCIVTQVFAIDDTHIPRMGHILIHNFPVDFQGWPGVIEKIRNKGLLAGSAYLFNRRAAYKELLELFYNARANRNIVSARSKGILLRFKPTNHVGRKDSKAQINGVPSLSRRFSIITRCMDSRTARISGRVTVDP